MMRPLVVTGTGPLVVWIQPYSATIPAIGGTAAFLINNGVAPVVTSSDPLNLPVVMTGTTGFTVTAPAAVAPGTLPVAIVAALTLTDPGVPATYPKASAKVGAMTYAGKIAAATGGTITFEITGTAPYTIVPDALLSNPLIVVTPTAAGFTVAAPAGLAVGQQAVINITDSTAVTPRTAQVIVTLV